MSPIYSRIKQILQLLQQNIYEKDTEVALTLLAAIAGENVLLLGPPGIAKSMIARQLKLAFHQAHTFEYLMSRFSTPDEIFGPVSISRLKENDTYERITTGYLPSADIVFLDEIWKAGPAIQNTLLTVMNEKIFRNGNQEQPIPLKLLIGASNELPAHDEGLEALWDRFLIRIVSQCIQEENLFRTMLQEDENDTPSLTVPKKLAISAKEYIQWQKEAHKITLTDEVLESITVIRQRLQQVSLSASDLPRRIYISDRRWKHIARLLRTSAFLQGRSCTSVTDLFPMYHALWNEPEEIDEVRHIMLQAVFHSIHGELHTLGQQIQADLHAHRAQEALALAVRNNDHRDDHLFIAHRYFYQLKNHGTGHTYIYITDYKALPMRKPFEKQTDYVTGIIYTDPQQKQRQIIRVGETGCLHSAAEQPQRVTLNRDESHLFINGTAYEMRENGLAILNPVQGSIDPATGHQTSEGQDPLTLHAPYEEAIERVCQRLEQLKTEIEQHLFIGKEDQQRISDYIKQLNKQIALTRVDLRKLLYDEE